VHTKVGFNEGGWSVMYIGEFLQITLCAVSVTEIPPDLSGLYYADYLWQVRVRLILSHGFAAFIISYSPRACVCSEYTVQRPRMAHALHARLNTHAHTHLPSLRR
jgi:hypothetical protein